MRHCSGGRAGIEQDGFARLDLGGCPLPDGALRLVGLSEPLSEVGLGMSQDCSGASVGSG
jgi:hypothetical protein